MDSQKLQEWLEQAREAFFAVDLTKIDRGLTEEERVEWNSIYASFRSGSLIQGEVIGLERVTYLPFLYNEETQTVNDENTAGMLCLTITPYRVKILIPEPLVWYEYEERESYVMQSMAGAKVDFVIIAIDRMGNCAIASRAMALARRRWEAREMEHLKVGDIVPGQVLAVGPSLVTLTACGYDCTLAASGLSYAYLGDLRDNFRPGQTVKVRILAVDEERLEFSVKDAATNPYEGADKRHPVGAIRLATITNKYKGGVFCRLSDGCTAVCRYARHFTDDQFVINDMVSIQITSYSDDHQWLRGKIRGKIG